MEAQEIKFNSFALVELFGHNQLCGRVTEETIAGISYVRIDVPKTSTIPEFTKYHHPSAIYGITPVDEEYCVKMAEKMQVQPINDYKHNEVIKELIANKVKDLRINLLDEPF
jgi:hypothetical protein